MLGYIIQSQKIGESKIILVEQDNLISKQVKNDSSKDVNQRCL